MRIYRRFRCESGDFQAGTGEGVDCNIRLVSPGCDEGLDRFIKDKESPYSCSETGPGPFNVDAKNLKVGKNER